jgi:hypothetical protein
LKSKTITTRKANLEQPFEDPTLRAFKLRKQKAMQRDILGRNLPLLEGGDVFSELEGI